MSIEDVSQTRTIQGFEVTVKRYGPMQILAAVIITKQIEALMDRIEKTLREEK